MAIDPRKVLPTKINLIRLRREERVIRRIRGIIEEKRDVLLHYIRSLADEYNRYQKEVIGRINEVFTEYYKGVAEEGLGRVEGYAYSVPESLRVDVGTRILFAVKTPTFKLVDGTMAFPHLPGDASPSLVNAYLGARELVPYIFKLLEYDETIRRMLEELRSTQRLINALDYVILPSYAEAIKFIKSVLEERMREDFIRLKILKRKLEERAEEARVAATQAVAEPRR